MEKINIDAINKIKIPARQEQSPFLIYWIQATSSENRDTLNHRFHHHAFFELHFITEGEICYGFKEKSITVRSGQFIVVPPLMVHRVEDHSAEFCKLTVAMEIEKNSPEFDSMVKLCARVFDIDRDVISAISIIGEYSRTRQEYSVERISLWLQAVVYGVLTKAPHRSVSQNLDDSPDTRFLKAKKYIEDNHDVFFSCDEVARYCHLSTKQLGRLFLQYEGIGLSEFIRNAKLDAAKRMLSQSDRSQKRISEDLGFSSVNYFSKFFSKYEGVSPDEFRKKMRK